MYIVTGGAGFIGSCVAADLVRQRHDVAIIDWLGTSEKWRNLQKDVVQHILPPTQVDAFVGEHGAKIRGVFHMGANSATTAADGDEILAVNIDSSKFWWTWCAAKGVPLVYASSAATYGDGSQGFLDDDSPEALAKLRPLNLYGWSKLHFDRWAVQSARRGVQPPFWAGLKFFNVYGPNEQHKGDMKSVVAKNYSAVAAGQIVNLFRSHRSDYADGGQLRDFVYVKDCVRAACWLMVEQPASGLYNIGSGTARSFSDLIASLGIALGKQAAVNFVEMPESIREKYQYYTKSEMRKLISAGYPFPLTQLEDGVGEYAREYLVKNEPY